jgi:Raf kinase inhibitor-like YbhB/YbcL family protein
MKTRVLLACVLAVSCSRGSDAAKAAALAVDRPETRAAATFSPTSRDFVGGGAIPLRFSAYGDGISPSLAWSGLPDRTKTLAVMMEDPDATSTRPFVHWLAWNIDPAAGGLAEGRLPPGAAEGRNSRGSAGYFGPRPHGSKPHHYHFQLFALDSPLALQAGATRRELLAAMNGHVLGKGDLVGLFTQP